MLIFVVVNNKFSDEVMVTIKTLIMKIQTPKRFFVLYAWIMSYFGDKNSFWFSMVRLFVLIYYICICGSYDAKICGHQILI